LKAVFLTALILMALLGCNRPAVTTVSAPIVSVPTAPFQETAEDDKAVFSAVLTHFAKQEVSGNASIEGVKKVIVVDSNSEGSSGYLSEDQLNAEFHEGEWKLPAELHFRLRDRNSQAASVTDLVHGKNIVVDDLSKLLKDPFSDAFDKKYPQAIGYVFLNLPAYSQDGTQAVVRFSFGPTPHGATATYLLVKEKGNWIVKHHKMVYYA
jgi:hypothetical protein